VTAGNGRGGAARWAHELGGLSWAKLMAIVREIDEHAADELVVIAAPGLDGHGGDHTSEQGKARLRCNVAQQGNSSSYLAARLKRDRPDLAAEVEAGRMKLRDAARKAGIVKPPDSYRQLVLWWDRASPKDRACFHTYLKAWAEKEDA
jgi:hypothetical protein